MAALGKKAAECIKRSDAIMNMPAPKWEEVDMTDATGQMRLLDQLLRANIKPTAEQAAEKDARMYKQL